MGTPFEIRKRLKKQAKLLAHLAFRAIFSGDGREDGAVDISNKPPVAPSEPSSRVQAPATTQRTEASGVADERSEGTQGSKDGRSKPQAKPSSTNTSKKGLKTTSSTSRARKSSRSKESNSKELNDKKKSSKPASSSSAKTKKTPKSAPKSVEPEVKELSKEEKAAERQKAHWEKTRRGVLAFLLDNDGSATLREMHDYSERKYFIAHQSFSKLMEELTDGGLVEFDFDSGVATITEDGRNRAA